MIIMSDELSKPPSASTSGTEELRMETKIQFDDQMETSVPALSSQPSSEADDIDEIMLDFVEQDQGDGLSIDSSLNSDDCVYAYRGRIEIMANNNVVSPENHQNQQNDEEETDFLEMDFEPETNSEIENYDEYEGNQINGSLELAVCQLPPQNGLHNENDIKAKHTGTKPKIPSASSSKSLKLSKSGTSDLKLFDNYYGASSAQTRTYDSSSLSLNFKSPATTSKCEQYNPSFLPSLLKSTDQPGSSRDTPRFHNTNQFTTSQSTETQLLNNQHTYDQQVQSGVNREMMDFSEQFLGDHQKSPRNSVTIYTTNCDEKILVDALSSLHLLPEPNRDIIASYFNPNAPPQASATSVAHENVANLSLVDYIIYKSKLNCNYKKLIEVIHLACKNIDEDHYGSSKKIDVNFYTLDLFSNQPEFIDLNVNEVVKRYTSQTDLRQLITIKNRYFYQTNVLGKIVNIIRQTHQPGFKFKDTDIIKIPQFYKSGYITITSLK